MKLIVNFFSLLFVLLCLNSATAQSEADAATIVLEQTEVTDQPKLGLDAIVNLDLSKASPARRVELALLGADYALALRRFELVAPFLDTAASSWDSLSPTDRAMAQFLHMSLQQKSYGLTAPGPARKSLLKNLERALETVGAYQVTKSEDSPWVCSHYLIGRAFGYWARELVEHQLLIEQDVSAPLRLLKERAQDMATKWATTEQDIPTLAVSHGYLRELQETQEILDPKDPLYPVLSQEEHLAEVRKIARERGAGDLADSALEHLEAYRLLYEARRLADRSWGRTYTEAEASEVRNVLTKAFEITKEQANLHLTAELFVTSFEASFASVKPGWMETARKRFLQPPAFIQNYPLISARYFLARARFQLLDGKADSAANDAQLAVDIYQTWFQEAGFSDEGLTSVRREASKAYETLIEARLRSDDVQGAFTAAASYQVLEGLSVLAVRGKDNAFEQASADLVARAVKPGEALLLYFPGRSKLYSFLMTQDKLRAEEIDVESSVLRLKVLEHLRSIRQQLPLDTSSQELYELLMGRHQLEEFKTLRIAPSSFLANLPWGSLLDSQGEPLSASRSCVVTLAFSEPEQTRRVPQQLRAIGNPDGSLPQAEMEVREIIKLMTPSEAGVGPEATREFVDAFSGGVMHFATHGLVNYRKPQSSHLLLAAGDQLTAREIVQKDWPGAKLVVLSACNTGTNHLDSIGHRSLAGAFLKAGVPNVLGTLWPVDDQATRIFMREFYTAMTAGKTPQDSLKQAQGKLRENPEFQHPVYWGGFVLFEV